MNDEIPLDSLLSKLMKLGVKRFEVLGGEPFIHKNKLLHLLEYAKENKIDIDSISTNGLIYNRDISNAIRGSNIKAFKSA